MPKVTPESATNRSATEHYENRHDEVDGITIAFERYTVDADFGPLFRGLPDDRCQCPHWGYVRQGRLVYRYADSTDEITAGEAYYARPGHVSIVFAGTELVEVSPSAALAKTAAVMARNRAAGVQPGAPSSTV
ncbi:MAG TPA: cupin domain-containing protein [Actinomycetes bacterium]|nr:cupin domain-containing protein [Actinomycetes bacterium]